VQGSIGSLSGDALLDTARTVCDALAAAPHGFAVVRADGSCVAMNRSLAASLRSPSEPLIPSSDVKLSRALWRAQRGETVVFDNSRLPALDGARQWRLRIAPFRVCGVSEAIAVYVEDVTATVRADAVTLESEQRFRLLAETVSDAVLVERGGVVLYANKSLALSIGETSGATVIGRRVDELDLPIAARVELPAEGGAASLVVFVRDAADSRPPEESGSRRVDGARPVVLVCDDEPRLTMLTAGLLEQGGFAARTTVRAEEALQLVDREGPPAMLLLDVNLTGLSAAHVLRALDERGLDVPVVLTSGYAEEDLDPLLLSHPLVRGYLAKPYTMGRLIQAVQDAVMSAGTRRAT
jgi:CheY-like chemotaxis protein